MRRVNDLILILFAVGLISTRADTQTWSTTTGDWFVVDNWTNITAPENTRVPVAGDDVVVTNLGALVYLTNSTAQLSSLLISNATVSCSNWDTTIYVTNMTILKNGILTCEGPFTNNVMSNRVSLNCVLLFIENNGSINVQSKGYAGGLGPSYGTGNGPGGGVGICGAGYGGAGVQGQAVGIVTNTYGSATAPLDPGSGGGGGAYAGQMGGHGGGAVCITAVQVVVNGSINAGATNVGSSTHGSGGSGGGIYIVCSTITGTNGAITANAGNPQSGVNLGGGAGGGRIAVIYNTGAQGAISPVPSIRFSAASTRSGGQSTWMPGDIGTLYFPDNYFFFPTNLFTGQWLSPEPVSVSLSDWTVSNVWTRMSASRVTITNTLTVAGTNYEICKLEITNNTVISCGQMRLSGATFVMGYSMNTSMYSSMGRFSTLNLSTSGPTLTCSGDLTLTNASWFYVSAGLTNAGAAAGYGASVGVGGTFRVISNCWVCPVAHSTNGAVPLFSLRNLTLDYGGGFNAAGLGYGGGPFAGDVAANAAYGPGATNWNCGSGYGGAGGRGYYSSANGQVYGVSNAPVSPGSGARAGNINPSGTGPFGGGSAQINATDTVIVQGTIKVNGMKGHAAYGPGSSGGAIYIICRRFIGYSNGVLSANGGDSYDGGGSSYGGGGGGGGRIAVWRIFDNSPSVISNGASGGVGWAAGSGTNYAGAGTIVWGWMMPPNGTIVTVY